MIEREKIVVFADEETKNAFEKLKEIYFEKINKCIDPIMDR